MERDRRGKKEEENSEKGMMKINKENEDNKI